MAGCQTVRQYHGRPYFMQEDQKSAANWIEGLFMETFGLSPGLSLLASLLIGVVVVFAVFWFFHSAPPHTITLTSGPPGSSFELTALKFQAILKQKGVTLKILPSEGSEENLQRLQNPSTSVGHWICPRRLAHQRIIQTRSSPLAAWLSSR